MKKWQIFLLVFFMLGFTYYAGEISATSKMYQEELAFSLKDGGTMVCLEINDDRQFICRLVPEEVQLNRNL